MAEKQLMNLTFKSLTGLINFNLGCNSSDNLTLDTSSTWHDSKDEPLGQIGAMFYPAGSGNVQASTTYQSALRDELTKAGSDYGYRVGLIHNNTWLNIPMYLNGVAVDPDGNAMPYLQWELNSHNTPELYYYNAAGTRLNKLIRYGSLAGSYSVFWAGKLYTDGTFTGCKGNIRPHVISSSPLILSTKRYEWQCRSVNIIDAPIFYDNVLNDLQEYLPMPSEGDYTGEGEGDFDATSDPIGFPGLPSISALDTGMIGMYMMTTAEAQSLSQFLWSGLFDLDTFKKMFSDPMQAILNLCISPVEIAAANLVPGATIRIGNINTSVTSTRVTNPYKIIDFGKINLHEYWGTFADYSPYTRLSIYLPYIGVQTISIDDVMNGSIQLKAYCDVLTGSVQYCLLSSQGNHRNHGHNSVLYTWGGNAQYQIPITASNFSQVISSLIGSAATIGGTAALAFATGGLTAPMAISSAGGLIGNVMNAKTSVQRGGGLGGSVGIFGVQTPYLILERPEQVAPSGFAEINGIPNETIDYLKNYSGYVKVREIHMLSTTATSGELSEIERILKEGVEV